LLVDLYIYQLYIRITKTRYFSRKMAIYILFSLSVTPYLLPVGVDSSLFFHFCHPLSSVVWRRRFSFFLFICHNSSIWIMFIMKRAIIIFSLWKKNICIGYRMFWEYRKNLLLVWARVLFFFNIRYRASFSICLAVYIYCYCFHFVH